MLGWFEVIWKLNIKGWPRRSTTSHLRGLMCFYVIMCVSWAYEVLIWVKILYTCTVLSFVEFGGQTSKKVVCLETTLCVLACFVEFYVFVFDEIDMGGTKLLYNHIRVGNLRVRSFKKFRWWYGTLSRHCTIGFEDISRVPRSSPRPLLEYPRCDECPLMN